jgi:hypothetical protein
MDKTITECLAEALKPFADSVFNDNGDITVDSSFVNYDAFVKANLVYKRYKTHFELPKLMDNYLSKRPY